MIFDKTAYIIKNNTRNNTNTKDYSYLKGDYIYEVLFSHMQTDNEYEGCIVGKSGYKFGLYAVEAEWLRVSDPIFSTINSTVKWCWFSIEEGTPVYRDIFFGAGNTQESYENHLRWWREFIKENSPIPLDDEMVNKLTSRWGEFNSKIDISSIKEEKLKEWIQNIEAGRKRTGSYVIEKTKVTVFKEDKFFSMYINDILYDRKPIGNLLEDSNATICIGVDDPYKEEGVTWFSGEIFKLDIYNDSTMSKHTLYSSFDFKTKTHFKLFDLSRNGNHAELFETEEFKNEKNIEFNKLARPAKIL